MATVIPLKLHSYGMASQVQIGQDLQLCLKLAFSSTDQKYNFFVSLELDSFAFWCKKISAFFLSVLNRTYVHYKWNGVKPSGTLSLQMFDAVQFCIFQVWFVTRRKHCQGE